LPRGAANLFHFVFENGGTRRPGSRRCRAEGRFDLAAMARAAGYAFVASFDDADAFAALAAPATAWTELIRAHRRGGWLLRYASSAGTRLDLQMQRCARAGEMPRENHGASRRAL
jgi:hypothetical protein